MKSKNYSATELGEINLLIRVKIINSFNLSEEAFLKKNFCDRETLFKICLPSFKKLLREKTDIKFISLYLSNLKKFSILLKTLNEDNYNIESQNQKNFEKYIKLLKNISEHINYENYSSKRLIMRYGDKADKYFIILQGLISVIIPIKISIELSFSEYCRYIAVLILYEEYELAKIILKDNKPIYNIDIPDMKFIVKYINKNKIIETHGKDDKKNYFLSIKNRRTDKNVHFQKNGYKISNYLDTGKDELNKSFENENKNEIQNEKKIETFMAHYLTREELILFMKNIQSEENNDNIEITPDIYVNRLKAYKNNNENQFKEYSNDYYSKYGNYLYDNDIKKTLNIYEYQEIIKLETGEMFGEIALGQSSSKRTATIITLTDSHFGCLNSEYYNSIKEPSDKSKKNKINFLYHIKLFKNIHNRIMENKYFNYFVFKDIMMDQYIIKNGEKNPNLIIIKNGSFDISFNGKLKDIYYLMNYYKKSYKDNFSEIDAKKYKINDFISKKISKLNSFMNKIQKLFGEENLILENKLFLIDRTSIFGLKETEDKNDDDEYFSFFDIKCISSEGQYVLLDKKIFYRQIYGTDFKIKEETKLYVKEFVEKTINRFVHVLYSRIWSILTKNELTVFKAIKKVSSVSEETKNEKKNNLMYEIGLDFNYMNENDLTDIECIIDKILKKYNEDAFNYKSSNTSLYNYCENRIKNEALKKKMIKLEEEKIDNNKIRSTFNELREKQKTRSIKLINFQRNNSLLMKRNKKIKIPKFLKLNINNNDKIKKRGKSVFTPKTVKCKLSRTTSTFYEEKKSEISYNNNNNSVINVKNSRNYINKNNSLYSNKNEQSKKFSIGPSKVRTIESYLDILDKNNNYCIFNNALISKINFTKKNDSLYNDIESISYNKNNNNEKKVKYSNLFYHKLNKVINKNENIKNKIRCYSVKNKNNSSNISIFDSTQKNKDSYIEQRKEYILKNTRTLFTRNKNYVLCKRIRKKS